MNNIQLSQGELLRMVVTRLVLGIPLLVAILFLPAGTFAYWHAWLYLGILFVPMMFVIAYLLKKDPELLERRMRTKEKQVAQKRIVILTSLYLLIVFLLPGLDYRFGWSEVPVTTVVVADVIVVLGYGLVFLVFKENRYASRIIETEQEQTVITTGVYAIVRHPMYLGICLMYIFSPLALGSYWGMLLALLIIPILVARIRNEESVLAKELKGYPEYMKHTKYHLIPGIW